MEYVEKNYDPRGEIAQHRKNTRSDREGSECPIRTGPRQRTASSSRLKADHRGDVHAKYRGLKLAIRIGNIGRARTLLKELDQADLPSEIDIAHTSRMFADCEVLERRYGVGCLLDLRHPLVLTMINTGRVSDEQIARAQRLFAKIGDYQLDRLVPGLRPPPVRASRPLGHLREPRKTPEG